MNILITGGAGFIGSNAAKYFAEQGHNVVCLDNLYLGSPENLPNNKNITFIQGDACKKNDLEQCGSHFDVIIALAGTSSAPMFMKSEEKEKNMPYIVWAYQNSINSFIQTLEFAKKTGTKKVLYASTSSLYGNNPLPLLETQQVTPPNHYAVTKMAYEHIANCYTQVEKELDIIGFRFMSVYGPNEEAKGQYANMISQFIWDATRGLPPVIYGNGEQFRDFTHVSDVVQAMQKAIQHKNRLHAEVFNIGRGESTSFNAIFEQITKKIPQSVPPIYIPNPVKEGYVKGQHADITKIKKILGYEPKITLEQGINDIIQNLDKKKIKQTSSDSIREKYR